MKPREIIIEIGYEGQLIWPPGSPSSKVSEKILFREVIEIDWKKILEDPCIYGNVGECLGKIAKLVESQLKGE